MSEYERFTDEELDGLLEHYKDYLKKFNVSDDDFRDILKNYPKYIYNDFISKIPAMIKMGMGVTDVVDIAMFIGMLWERSRKNDSI